MSECLYPYIPPADAGESISQSPQSIPNATVIPGHDSTLQTVIDLKVLVAKLDPKLDGLDAAFNAKFDGLSNTFNAKFDGLSAKVDTMDTRVSTSLGSLEAKVDNLTSWKHKIFGVVNAIMVMGAVLWALFAYFSSKYEIMPRREMQEQHQPATKNTQ